MNSIKTQGKLGVVGISHARLMRVGLAALAVGLALPLVSLLLVPQPSWPFVAVVWGLVVLSAVQPAAGVAAAAGLVPMAFAVARATEAALSAASATEAMALAASAGLALSWAWRPTSERTRLGWPALAIGAAAAASGAYMALAQFGSFAEAGRAVGDQLVRTYFISSGPVRELQSVMRWIEGVALAALVERTVRASPFIAGRALSIWLLAGSAVAAMTVVRFLEVVFAGGEGFAGAVNVFMQTRVSAVYADLNAAGSIFAATTVTAVVFAARARSWGWLLVAPVPAFAMLATQSRAALAAAVAVLAATTLFFLARSGRTAAAVLVLVAAGAAVAATALVDRETHATADAALHVRAEMGRIALKVARDHPVFGVGPGRFQDASRDFVEENFARRAPEAAGGENAHNQVLQVLGELGLVGAIAFCGMLWALTGPPSNIDAAPARTALVTGWSAFLVSALFGHPLLIVEIAASAFLALGLAAALSRPPAPIAPVRVAGIAIVAVVAATLPFRAFEAVRPGPPEAEGVSEPVGERDGLTYRVAEQESTWRVRAHSRFAVLTVRWDAGAAADCRLRLTIQGRPADERPLRSDAWQTLRYAVPPGGRARVPPVVSLIASSPSCRLLVAEVRGTR